MSYSSKPAPLSNHNKARFNSVTRFVISFIGLFLLFYGFNIAFFGLTSPGGHYNAFLAGHLNYIHWLRQGLLKSSALILQWLGYQTITNEYQLLVAGKGIIQLVYACLGLGVMSFFAAFVLSYPKPWRLKLLFLLGGLLIIQMLNIIRFVVLSLYWNSSEQRIIDHHTLFNITIYLLIIIALYFWVREPKHSSAMHEN